jgi:uncharacterized membrane protein
LKLKLVGAFAVAFPFFATPSASFAAGNLLNIEICNKFSQTVFFAMAYQQKQGNWLTRGWLNIATGTCGYFDTALSVPEFYFRAETKPYRQKGHLVESNWAKGGARSFCVNTNLQDSFNYWHGDTASFCTKSGYVPFLSFSGSGSSFSTDVDGSYTVTFNADETEDMNFAPLK